MSVRPPEADAVRPAKHVEKEAMSNLALVRIRFTLRSGHLQPSADIHFPANWSAGQRLAFVANGGNWPGRLIVSRDQAILHCAEAAS